jgi:hypothetical protein
MNTTDADALQQTTTDALRQALEAVETALRDIEAELGPRELHVALLREKRDDLTEAASRLRRTLQATVSDDAFEPPAPEPPASEDETEAPSGPARPMTTVEGVVQVLTDLGGSGSLADVRREYRERGWVDSAFKNPDAALYAATKRLAKAKRLVRLGGGQYRLVPKEPNGQEQEGGM